MVYQREFLALTVYDHDDKHTTTSSKTFIFYSSGRRSVSVRSSDQRPPSLIPTPPPELSSCTQYVHVRSLSWTYKFFKIFSAKQQQKDKWRCKWSRQWILTAHIRAAECARRAVPLQLPFPFKPNTHTNSHTFIEQNFKIKAPIWLGAWSKFSK